MKRLLLAAMIGGVLAGQYYNGTLVEQLGLYLVLVGLIILFLGVASIGAVVGATMLARLRYERNPQVDWGLDYIKRSEAACPVPEPPHTRQPTGWAHPVRPVVVDSSGLRGPARPTAGRTLPKEDS